MIENITQRFFKGQTTPEEEKTLFQWLNSDPSHIQSYISERKIYDLKLIAGYEDPLNRMSPDVDSEYLKLIQKIQKEKATHFFSNNSKIISLMKHVAGYAAAVLLGFLLWHLVQPPVSVEKEEACLIKYNTMTIPEGNRMYLRLPDSTLVWLNTQTELRYPESFSKNTREVWLNGEAYFEVTHDPDRQFIVHTGEFDVLVHGTTFNIYSYDDSQSKEFTLIEGSIKLTNPHMESFSGLLLNPTEKATYKSGKLTVKQVNTDHETAWREGKFYFDNKSFATICEQLGYYFGVNIKIEGNQLKSSTFTGQFIHGETLQEILTIITHDKRIHYQVAGKNITITENINN